jgi:hypothetical protein
MIKKLLELSNIANAITSLCVSCLNEYTLWDICATSLSPCAITMLKVKFYLFFLAKKLATYSKIIYICK